MGTNPTSITIPANDQCEIVCAAHAAYWQVMTVTVGGFDYTFSGNGEGRAMKMPNGQTMLRIDPSEDDQTASFNFKYTDNYPSGTPVPARSVQSPIVTANGSMTITSITSEDGFDGDNNDTYVTVVCMVPPSEEDSDIGDDARTQVILALHETE